MEATEPLPFEADTFDEIHAYEVLEHIRSQGDWRALFRQFSDYWRVLKPDGWFYGSVPLSDGKWAWGDPGHRCVIPAETFIYLSQREYRAQVGVTAMTDYRHWYKADFELRWAKRGETSLYFALQAIKE